MRHITDLRTWNNSKKNDFRVYVTFDDGSEGCYYKDGNAYNVKGTLENMTIEEKKAALALSESRHGKNTWGEVRHWEINKNEESAVNPKSHVTRDEEDLDVKSRSYIGRDRYGIADM